MRHRLVLCFISCLVPALAWPAGLTFKSRGKTVKTLDLAALEKIVPARTITVFEPHENRDVTYRALPMNAVLDAILKSDWKTTEEVLFTCSDGYQPSVPVSQFKKYEAYLAFERPGRPDFDVDYQGQRVKLGPFYVIWDNHKFPDLKPEGMNDWPYQVVSLDLIRFADRFPRMAPPAGASETAKRGFLRFRRECQACHSINGEGGTKGIELNYPVSVTEYFARGWLRKWIADPQSIRYNTRMPGINHSAPHWERNLDDTLEYLKAMAQAKRKPS